MVSYFKLQIRYTRNYIPYTSHTLIIGKKSCKKVQDIGRIRVLHFSLLVHWPTAFFSHWTMQPFDTPLQFAVGHFRSYVKSFFPLVIIFAKLQIYIITHFGGRRSSWLVWPWQQCYVVVHSKYVICTKCRLEHRRQMNWLPGKISKESYITAPFLKVRGFWSGQPHISLQLVNGNHEGNRFAHIKPPCSTLIPPQVSTIIDRLTIDAIWSILNSYNQPSLLNVCSQLCSCEMEGQVKWSNNLRGHNFAGNMTTWSTDHWENN
jgi:hypothetical protein